MLVHLSKSEMLPPSPSFVFQGILKLLIRLHFTPNSSAAAAAAPPALEWSHFSKQLERFWGPWVIRRRSRLWMLPQGKGGYWEGGGVGWGIGERQAWERRCADGGDSLQLPATWISCISYILSKTSISISITPPHTFTHSALIGGCTCWLMNMAEVWEIAL